MTFGRSVSQNLTQVVVNAASSTGRCNTFERIDSAMLPRENHLFGCTRPKASQGSVPAGLTLASGFGLCFQCQGGSSLVLHRPIEITAIIGHIKSDLMISPLQAVSGGHMRSHLLGRNGLLCCY